ncbi:MAG: alpha/beta fold hydrolase, partial [Promethearchaeota archaeon]
IAKIDDTELYYETCGTGTPFLVMHGGLGIDHSYFRPSFDRLGDIFQLIYYDHRGHGQSKKVLVDSMTYEQLADDANNLREELGHEKLGVIGHSAGGFVALHYALRHQKHLSYLILLDTAPAFDHMEEIMTIVQKRNPTPDVMAAFNAPTADSEKELKDQLLTMHSLYFYEYTSELEKKMTNIIDKMIVKPELMKRSDELLSTYNVSSELTKIKVPTLILVGRDDFVCPPSQAERMHRNIPNSEKIIIEKCGHYPFVETPDDFFREVGEWFKKIG